MEYIQIIIDYFNEISNKLNSYNELTFDEAIKIFDNLNSIITDSYTILAGFVAIGIPLSLQIIEKLSEKYESEYVRNILYGGQLSIRPNFICITSFIYIVTSLYLKFELSIKLLELKNSTILVSYFVLFVILFFILFGITLFYWALYKSIVTPKEKYIRNIIKSHNRSQRNKRFIEKYKEKIIGLILGKLFTPTKKKINDV